MSETYVCVTHSYCPWWELAEMGVVVLGAAEWGSMPSQLCHYVHHSMYGMGVTCGVIVI